MKNLCQAPSIHWSCSACQKWAHVMNRAVESESIAVRVIRRNKAKRKWNKNVHLQKVEVKISHHATTYLDPSYGRGACNLIPHNAVRSQPVFFRPRENWYNIAHLEQKLCPVLFSTKTISNIWHWRTQQNSSKTDLLNNGVGAGGESTLPEVVICDKEPSTFISNIDEIILCYWAYK